MLTQQQMMVVRMLEMPLAEFENAVQTEIDDNPALEISPDEMPNEANEVDDTIVSTPEEEERQNLGGRLDIFSLIDRFQNFTIWQWILILIALILITYLLYKAERHRLLKKRERKQKAATENGESEA